MSGRKGAQHASNILEVLESEHRPLSAYDLLDRLRPTGIAAPLTVYRALDKLIAAGKVHRVESLNAFVACRHEGHHHDAPSDDVPRQAVGFAICDRCGAVEEFAEPDVFAALMTSLVARGFHPRASAIEVRGLCAACGGATR